MVIGIRDNSDVAGQGYILPPQPAEINEDLRRRCLEIEKLQGKLKTEATRTTRSYNRLKEYAESSVQDMRSSLAEVNQPVGSNTIAIATIVGGAVTVGFGLLSNPSKQSALLSADSLFRNADVLKGVCIAAGASLIIAGVVSSYLSGNWTKYKLHGCFNEICKRRSRYFESINEAYNVAELLHRKSNDARYSEIFFEMFPGDSGEYRIASEMFNMTKQTSDFILENCPLRQRNRTTWSPTDNVQNTCVEMIAEFITWVQRDMARVEETKNALTNLHSYRQ